MNSRHRPLLVLALAGALLGGGTGAARGDVISVPPTGGTSFAFSPDSATGTGTLTLAFPKFDPALGSLSGLALRLNSLIAHSAEITLTASPDLSGELISPAEFRIAAPGIATFEPLLSVAFCIGDLSTGSCFGSDPTSSALGDPLDPLDPTSPPEARFVVTGPDLAFWSGSGTVDAVLTITVTNTLGCDTGADCAGNLVTSWKGLPLAEFTFTPGDDGVPVPAPGGLALLAGGCIALAARRRAA